VSTSTGGLGTLKCCKESLVQGFVNRTWTDDPCRYEYRWESPRAAATLTATVIVIFNSNYY
jgi:hypothetical protein